MTPLITNLHSAAFGKKKGAEEVTISALAVSVHSEKAPVVV